MLRGHDIYGILHNQIDVQQFALKCLKDVSVNRPKVEEHEEVCTLMEKVTLKAHVAKRTVARDILAELEGGNYGILG